MIKKLVLAGFTAGALSLGMVSMGAQAPAQAGVHVNIGVGGPGWHRWHGKKCKWVKRWRHGHPVMVRKCWW